MIPQTNNKYIDTAIVIAVIILIVIIMNKIGKFISNPLGTISGASPEQGGTSQNVPVNESKLSFPKANYAVWCDQIENLCWGSGLFPDWITNHFDGDSWSADLPVSRQVDIAKIMVNLKNADDWAMMMVTYNKRGRGILISDFPNLIQTLQKFVTNKAVKDQINKALQIRKIPLTI